MVVHSFVSAARFAAARESRGDMRGDCRLGDTFGTLNYFRF